MGRNIHTCKICGKQQHRLKQHIIHEHNLTEKEYYDIYIRQPNEGICPVCGKETHFLSYIAGYRQHCSCRCSSLDKNVQMKNRTTNLELYGVEHNWNSGKLREHQEETMLQKYGVRHNWQAGELRSKERMKVSPQEQRFMDSLDELGVSYKYRYCDKDRYPYECDFYLNKLDIFIELNITPFHQHHFFDKHNSEDVKQLTKLQEKSKTSSWYESAVRIWLKDAEKLKTAKKNDLNYIVLWTDKDIDAYIEKLKTNMEAIN